MCSAHLLAWRKWLDSQWHRRSGAAISSAKATLSYENSGECRRVATDEEGHSLFKKLAGGEYLLSVESAGFQNFETTVRVAGASLNLNIRMKIAAGEQVTVRSTPAIASPESNSDALKINDNFLRVLPAESQNLSPLLARFLSPAASGTGGRPSSSTVSRLINSTTYLFPPSSAWRSTGIHTRQSTAAPARLALRSRLRRARPLCSTVAWPSTGEPPHSMPATRLQRPVRSKPIVWDATFSGPFLWKRLLSFLPRSNSPAMKVWS